MRGHKQPTGRRLGGWVAVVSGLLGLMIGGLCSGLGSGLSEAWTRKTLEDKPPSPASPSTAQNSGGHAPGASIPRPPAQPSLDQRDAQHVVSPHDQGGCGQDSKPPADLKSNNQLVELLRKADELEQENKKLREEQKQAASVAQALAQATSDKAAAEAALREKSRIVKVQSALVDGLVLEVRSGKKDLDQAKQQLQQLTDKAKQDLEAAKGKAEQDSARLQQELGSLKNNLREPDAKFNQLQADNEQLQRHLDTAKGRAVAAEKQKEQAERKLVELQKDLQEARTAQDKAPAATAQDRQAPQDRKRGLIRLIDGQSNNFAVLELGSADRVHVGQHLYFYHGGTWTGEAVVKAVEANSSILYSPDAPFHGGDTLVPPK